jgi:protein ImuB
VPDVGVPADGRQLGLWGGDQAAHDRADRALARVQGMLGYDAVVTAVVQGGRIPAEQVRWVPWGEPRVADRPLRVGTETCAWPGALPPPYPARVFDPPVAADLVDAGGRPVAVSGRGEQHRAPAHVHSRVVAGDVTAWAGPWVHDVRWWDSDARRRCVRYQLLVSARAGHEVACIAVVEGGHAAIEAVYD